jgi:N-acetylneuraminic acid mutarotase
VTGGGTADAALYEPTSNAWSQVGSMATARSHHTAALLPSGKVLVAGGMDEISLGSTEVYEPASQRWSPAGNLAMARSHHAACVLRSGQVLVTGGHAGAGPLASTELFTPP